MSRPHRSRRVRTHTFGQKELINDLSFSTRQRRSISQGCSCSIKLLRRDRLFFDAYAQLAGR